MNSKDEFLKHIDEFITSAEDRLTGILSQIGWSEEGLQQQTKDDDKLVVCQINAGHSVPLKSLQHHEEICSWISYGYTREEMNDQPPSSYYFYKDSSTVTSVAIDDKLQNEILRRNQYEDAESADKSWTFQSHCIKKVPRTMTRAVTELSVSERLAVYDYVAAQGRIDSKIKPEDLQFDMDNKSDAPTKEKSKLEILAEQRDYKRRRQSYRAKNVHITKKSYTEILREVIHNHTQALNPQSVNDEVLSSTSLPMREMAKEKDSVVEDRRGPKQRSRSRSKESYLRRREDHRHRRRSHSGDRDSSRQRHKSKREKHKHKSKKKSHKREHERNHYNESSSDS